MKKIEYEVLKFDEYEKAGGKGSDAFPLGAGGGGEVLVFGPDPDSLCKLREDLQDTYREIPFKIKAKGHELFNLPLKRR